MVSTNASEGGDPDKQPGAASQVHRGEVTAEEKRQEQPYTAHSHESHAIGDSDSDSEHDENEIQATADAEKLGEKLRRKQTAQSINSANIVDGGVCIDGEPSGSVDDDDEDDDDDNAARHTLSRASSSRSRPLVIVPRSERRGLFARLCVLPEVERPYDYKNRTKWCITLIISAAAAAAPMGSSIFYPALPEISKALNTSPTIGNLSVALYMLSMAIFPLFWSSFSEKFGRRSIYIISFSLFVVFSVLCAVSQNITMLIVFRLFGGGAAASVQAVGAGTISDIWQPQERGRAMGIFYLGPLMGPVIAPVIGGALAQGLGWQSTMWFLAIFGVIVVVLLLFCLPETLARRKNGEATPTAGELSRMTTRESAKVHTKKFTGGLKTFLIDPLKVVYILRFPAVLITVLLAAEAFAALYVVNISLEQKYSEPPYNFEQLIVGALYIAPGVGYFLASIFGGRWLDKIMKREAKKANRYDEKGRLVYLPEDRMRENMWLAHAVYPVAMIGYGWSLRYGVHFMVPEVALFFFGIASMLVFSAATTMLTEFVRKKSSAGVAVNNLVRNILSCIGVVVASDWIKAMNVGWVFTIISLWCIIFGNLGIWILRRNASKWRVAMNEALKDMN